MPVMTKEAAQTFQRYSQSNAAQLRAALRCGCQPYQDVYTYERWRALGFQVQRGQHSLKLPVIVERAVEDDDTGETKTIKRLWTGHVFCRCQVQPINGNGHAQPVPAARPGLPVPVPVTQSPAPSGNPGVDMSKWRLV